MQPKILRNLRLALLLLLAACAGPAAPGLAGSEWRPTRLGAADLPAASGIFLRFEDDGRLAGSGGCNRFFGSYKLDGDKIEIGSLGATRMA
jgi:heat shock protein HslJ